MESQVSYTEDLFSDRVILEPYEHYRLIRDLGPVVWLPAHHIWTLARYADVTAALRNHEAFSSASGVSVSDPINQASAGTMIASDPPRHDALRKIVGAPLTPSAVAALRPQIEGAAEGLVGRLVERRSFDAVTDLAQYLPLTIVSHLVGLPESVRDRMLPYAAATFDLFGPQNERWNAALPIAQSMRAYIATLASRDKVKTGSWADKLLDHVEQGAITSAQFGTLLRDYLGPSLDTTIFAMTNLIWLFSQYPDQWELLRKQPNLIRSAIDEAVRLESPIRGFTRLTTRAVTVDGMPLPSGARVMLLYASANRDERKWHEPDCFRIERRTKDHVGFGFGVHSCAGMHLARLEIESVLKALLPRVRAFTGAEPTRVINNALRGFASLPVTLEVDG